MALLKLAPDQIIDLIIYTNNSIYNISPLIMVNKEIYQIYTDNIGYIKARLYLEKGYLGIEPNKQYFSNIIDRTVPPNGIIYNWGIALIQDYKKLFKWLFFQLPNEKQNILMEIVIKFDDDILYKKLSTFNFNPYFITIMVNYNANKILSLHILNNKIDKDVLLKLVIEGPRLSVEVIELILNQIDIDKIHTINIQDHNLIHSSVRKIINILIDKQYPLNILLKYSKEYEEMFIASIENTDINISIKLLNKLTRLPIGCFKTLIDQQNIVLIDKLRNKGLISNEKLIDATSYIIKYEYDDVLQYISNTINI